MSDERQLSFDGREVAIKDSVVAPLTDVQRAILIEARDGGVRSVEAGTILHSARSGGCSKGDWRYRGNDGCCRYASSDGSDACKRLMGRGLLERAPDGKRWIPTQPREA